MCAWLRPYTVRVPSRKSRQDSERLRAWRGHETLRWPIGRWRRGGKHLSMRRLVAEKGELGEDHSKCTSDQQLQPGVVEERSTPVTAPPDVVGKPANSMESAARRRKVVDSPSRGPGDIDRSGRGFPRSSIAMRPKASRTLWTYGRSAGAIQIWNGSRSRASKSSAMPPCTESKDSDGG